MTKVEYDAAMAKACPHGPDEPCLWHHVVGCCCDIDWDEIHELKMDGWTDPLEISDRWYPR